MTSPDTCDLLCLDLPRAEALRQTRPRPADLAAAAAAGNALADPARLAIAAAVLVGLAANAAFGAWWLDPLIGLFIAFVAVKEGREAWRGETCAACGPLPS